MAFGVSLDRILSRPTAKPYRSGSIPNDGQIHLNDDGHLEFAPDDIENPKKWSARRRWYVTVATICMVVNATFASSSPSGCLDSIAEELHVSREAANLVTTVFLLGYCFGPLFFAPLSEYYGRRYVFYITFLMYWVFNFVCAFTPNFGGLLAGRFLTGTFASAALSNSPGVLADIWGPIERGNAMVTYSVMTFAGPALGPVVSGFLQVTKDWRWTFYVLLWMGAGTMLIVITIPETLPSRVLTNKAKRIRAAKIPGYEEVQSPVEAENRSLADIFGFALTRPWMILCDPIALLVAIYLSIVYALLYMLFTIYPIIFQEHRGWNAGVGALPLIGSMVGAVIGGVIVFWESTFAKKKMAQGVERTPEDRMPLAMLGGVLFPVTMFWFAWSGNWNSVPWIVPTLGGVFLNTSIVLIFVSYLNYLTDSYLTSAASAMAGNTIIRSALAAGAPLWTEPMFSALGVGGAGSVIGGVACLLAVIPFLFYKYGRQIREKSKFAPTEDESSGKKKKKKEKEGKSQDGEPKASDERRTSSDGDDLATHGAAGLDEDVEKKSFEKSLTGDPFLDADGLEKADR